MDFYNKYIKYRSKYLSLKNKSMIGGKTTDWWDSLNYQQRNSILAYLWTIFDKNNILHPEDGYHELDKKELERWVNSQCSVEAKTVANAVKQCIRYVRWTEFKKTFEETCDILIDEFKKKGGEKLGLVMFLINEPGFSKSNFWMAHMFWNYAKDKISIDPLGTSDINTYEADILIVDDMMYSGSQMNKVLPELGYSRGERVYSKQIIPYIWTLVPYVNESKINTDYNEKGFIMKETTNRLGIKFKHIYKVKMPSLSGVYKKLGITSDVQEDFRKFFDTGSVLSNMCITYFDHKIADAASVPTQILCTGYVKGDTGCETQSIKFIKNTTNYDNYTCEQPIYKSPLRISLFELLTHIYGEDNNNFYSQVTDKVNKYLTDKGLKS